MRFCTYLLLIILAANFFSCKKDSDSISFTPKFSILKGGTSSFDENLILFSSSDTVTYNLIVSSTYLLSKTVTVNLAVSDEFRQSYNTANATDYKAMPTNAYSFQTSFMAESGGVYDTIPIKIYKQFLLSDNFMLPVEIKTVSDYSIDSTTAVVYIHTESSKLSGIYVSSGEKTFYSGSAADSIVTSTDSFSLNKTLIPQDANISLLDYADLGSNGWKYVLQFSSIDSSLIVSPNTVILNSVQAGSFEIIFSSFNSANSSIHIKTRYKNSGGNERIVDEFLTLQ